MKFLHTADLHIGKKIFEHSLLEDQRHILRQITEIALEEKVDALVIAGDVYDRAIPSTEAVTLLDDFLTGLQEKGIPVIMISGNHDSPERVSFADAILEKQGLYIAGNFQMPLKTVVLQDAYGPVHFVCMPFVKSAVVRSAAAEGGADRAAESLAGEGTGDNAEAVEIMLSQSPMTQDLHHRCVLVTHYFVTGEQGQIPELSDSETDIYVGGLDRVPASLFQNFSYVALGHIHKPQRIGAGQVYYSGAPLKYSFSEARGVKSVNIVELDGRGEVSVTRHPLKPRYEMRCIRGKLAELLDPAVLVENADCREDYYQVILTDQEELIDPMGTLRSVYPNVLQLVLEKNAAGQEAAMGVASPVGLSARERRSTEELFGEFYEMLKGEPMDERRQAVVEEVACEACGK